MKTLHVFNEFSWFGGSKLASFSYVFGVSVSRSFFDRLGVGFGVDLGSILAFKSDPNRRKKGLILGSIFGASLGANGTLFPGRGGPGGPLICARFQQAKRNRLELNSKGDLNKKKVQLFLSLFGLLLDFVFHKLMI